MFFTVLNSVYEVLSGGCICKALVMCPLLRHQPGWNGCATQQPVKEVTARPPVHAERWNFCLFFIHDLLLFFLRWLLLLILCWLLLAAAAAVVVVCAPVHVKL